MSVLTHFTIRTKPLSIYFPCCTARRAFSMTPLLIHSVNKPLPTNSIFTSRPKSYDIILKQNPL